LLSRFEVATFDAAENFFEPELVLRRFRHGHVPFCRLRGRFPRHGGPCAVKGAQRAAP
jgi:hypothetical protein